jgi:hypothetical protein
MNYISLGAWVDRVRADRPYNQENDTIAAYNHDTFMAAMELYSSQFHPLPLKAQQLERDRAKRLADVGIEEALRDKDK